MKKLILLLSAVLVLGVSAGVSAQSASAATFKVENAYPHKGVGTGEIAVNPHNL
ncbi:MAG: hypothetical protein ACI4T3_06160 [Lactobacillus sp.]